MSFSVSGDDNDASINLEEEEKKKNPRKAEPFKEETNVSQKDKKKRKQTIKYVNESDVKISKPLMIKNVVKNEEKSKNNSLKSL